MENLSFMHSEQFVQLPQLESPSLPLKRPNSVPLISDINEEDEQNRLSNTTEKVTDWRALDKFVASQLSHEDRRELNGLPNFETHNSSDMAALLLLQNNRDEVSKLSPFLNTSSDCDIGICVFEK
ncbi:hypothetical protein L6164_020133 [Bauhinia variegata]|nr:hypothetical protein L6164_020133 [Bauhinia variegata]